MRAPLGPLGLAAAMLLWSAPVSASASVSASGSYHVETGRPVAGSALSGVHEQTGPGAWTTFGSWRGASAQVIVDFMGTSTWTSIADSPRWLADKHAGLKGHFVLSMPMVPTSDASATVERCAQRYYDAQYRAIGRALVAYGYGSSTIRLGWEMTGDWFKWSQGNSRYFYASCWRNIVKDLRSVPGQRFTFDFNISDQHVDPRLWWPGGAYVDYVGGDFYDIGVGSRTDHRGSVWRELHGAYTADWVAAFAKAQGKPLAMTEWGLVWKCPTNSSYQWQGGDDPYYVQSYRDWIVAHRSQLAYESYFDGADGPCHTSALRSGRFPLASELYRRLW